MPASKVLVERDGPVTTVIINRPEVRNAVDNETAESLAHAFRAFDADPEQCVAILLRCRRGILRGRRSQGDCQR